MLGEGDVTASGGDSVVGCGGDEAVGCATDVDISVSLSGRMRTMTRTASSVVVVGAEYSVSVRVVGEEAAVSLAGDDGKMELALLLVLLRLFRRWDERGGMGIMLPDAWLCECECEKYKLC